MRTETVKERVDTGRTGHREVQARHRRDLNLKGKSRNEDKQTDLRYSSECKISESSNDLHFTVKEKF